MTVLRVAFCGASGTGKTTLARQVADALGLELQPSFARQVANDMDLASPYEVDALGRRDEFQRRVLDRLLAWQIGRHARGYVTDRTVWDAHAYTLMHASPGEGSSSLNAILRAGNGLGMERQFHFYTHVFLCPMVSLFQLNGDPARMQDRDYHERFEKLLCSLLEANGDPVNLSLIRFPIEARDRWVKSCINLLRHGVPFP